MLEKSAGGGDKIIINLLIKEGIYLNFKKYEIKMRKEPVTRHFKMSPASLAGDKKSEPTEVTFQRFQVSGKRYRQSDFISCS